MSSIQSTIGLITGIPIKDTVDQLMKISAQPRDRLVQRTALLSQEQLAISELTALVIGVQFSVRSLTNPTVFSGRKVESSQTSALTATVTGNPAAGIYEYTPLKLAQSNQYLSLGTASASEPIGAGTIALRQGGFVDGGVKLVDLNGGTGVQRGSIRITDRAGATAVVDLSNAVTIDDVLTAINSLQDVQVTATTRGDALHLADHSGGSGNLKVQEVGLGGTATDLGLGGINVAADSATGADVFRLYNSLPLSRLRDGAGVRIRPGVADLKITFADGSSPLSIDFNTLQKEASQATGTTVARHGLNSQVTFTSVGTGKAFDDVRIRYVNNSFLTHGNEKVTYDDSDPDNKVLTVNIVSGQTRSIDVVRALNNDPVVGALFTGSLPEGSNGTGIVHISDNTTTSGGAEVRKNNATIGQLLNTLNTADPARLQARISSAGDRLELVDLTSGSGTFSVSSVAGGSLAAELGLTGAASGGVISGNRLIGGLKSTLLSSLRGGAGIGSLGLLDITDRSGASASIDLSGAQTLDQVIALINDSGLGIEARVNSSRDGLLLRDTTGATASNLIVADNADGLTTATKLGIATDTAATEQEQNNLGREEEGRQTKLTDYRQGQGVKLGSFLIQDSSGASSAVNLKVANAETLGDVIDAINALTIGVTAKINSTGDGLLLIDTAGGSGTLKVTDVGSNKSAASLLIAGEAKTVDINGTPTQVIDGATTFRVEIDDDDTLDDVVKKINQLGAGVTAAVVNDGAGDNPFRLSIVSTQSGKAGELYIDSRNSPLSLKQVVAAQDALVRLGNEAAGAVLVTSSTNQFTNLLPGATINVSSVSATPVKVTVSEDPAPIISRVKSFVEQYNKVRAKLKDTRFFNEAANTVGPLFGSSEALRVENMLGDLATRQIFGAGPIRTLAEVGVTVNEDGTLAFNDAKLKEKFAEDSQAVSDFFTTPTLGVAARFDAAVEVLAGVGRSVLIGRNLTLQSRIDDNNDRAAFLTERLERERERLLNQFFQLESIIGKLQNSLQAVSSIQALPSLISLR